MQSILKFSKVQKLLDDVFRVNWVILLYQSQIYHSILIYLLTPFIGSVFLITPHYKKIVLK